MKLYRIDETKIWEDGEAYTSGGETTPGGVLVPVEPCEHGKYVPHRPGAACYCYTDRNGAKGRMANRAAWGEYISDEWVPCQHDPWCLGAGLEDTE